MVSIEKHFFFLVYRVCVMFRNYLVSKTKLERLLRETIK